MIRFAKMKLPKKPEDISFKVALLKTEIESTRQEDYYRYQMDRMADVSEELRFSGSFAAQDTNDTLPSLETLEASIIHYSTKECEAELTAYRTAEPKPWKELIPSIGFGYTVVGSLRPSLMWSPSQIFDRKERHNRNKNQKASLQLSCEMILSDRLHKIRQLHRNYLVDLRIIDSRRSTLLIDEELFAITERKYEEHLIKPSVYLAAKRAIVQARSDVEVMEMELEKLGYEVLYEGRWLGIKDFSFPEQ